MKTCIVIPMKDPTESKQRLANALDAQERQALALHLFKQTLDFLNLHFYDIPVVVVTPSAHIADIASKVGVKVLIEDGTGLNNAISMAAAFSCELGFESQLLLPADITDLSQSEIQTLLDHPRDALSVLICPAQDGGTNALLTSPPNIIPFCFGPQSSRMHHQAALERSVACSLLTMEKLAFDLDTPEDLKQWKKELSGLKFFSTSHSKALNTDIGSRQTVRTEGIPSLRTA